MPAPREREPLTDANRHLPETVIGLAKWAAGRFAREHAVCGCQGELFAEALYGAVLAASDYRPELGAYPSYARQQMFEQLRLWHRRRQRYSGRHVLCEPDESWCDTKAEGSGRVAWDKTDWEAVLGLLTRKERAAVEHVLSAGKPEGNGVRGSRRRDAARSACYRRALKKLRGSELVRGLAGRS